VEQEDQPAQERHRMNNNEKRPSVTRERLKELLGYDEATGLFFWKQWVAGKAFKGTVAGSKNTMGHIKMQIDGRAYLAHRLAWLYVHGNWPIFEIDHINGVRTDNRMSNLRDVPTGVNMQNKREAYKNNNTGFLGVYKKGKRFAAKIQIDGKGVYLGSFKTANEAHLRYVSEKRLIHPGNTI
jgi:hypothetical protein